MKLITENPIWFEKASKSPAHWSKFFYDYAASQGYRYAFRPHGNFNDLVMSNKKMSFMASDWAQKGHKYAFLPYCHDWESLIVEVRPNGDEWVVGYIADLRIYGGGEDE